MINFFRKIRKKLADNNQFLRYSRYAIGEIVLVMIGILLALQVNNLNEERIIDRFEQKVLVALKNEFLLNRTKLEYIQKKAEENIERMSEFSQYLMRRDYFLSDFTYEELVKNQRNPGGLKTFNPVNGVLKSLISSGRINSIKNDSLKYMLANWEDRAGDYIENNKLYLDWWNTVLLPYISNLPSLSQDYSLNLINKREVLDIYIKAYKDFKYWDLIRTSEFNLNRKYIGATDLLKVNNKILNLIDKETSSSKKKYQTR